MAGFTLTALSLILAGVGTATQVYGQVKAGKAQKKAGEAAQEAANSQAGLSDYNAEVATLQAQDAVDRGAVEESRFRTSVRGMIGQQRAGIAAGNIDVGFGSAVDVQADAAYLGELDALQLRTNAAREAWGYTVQAEDFRKRAAITRKEGVNLAEAGNQAKSAAYLGAVGSLVGGTSSLLQLRYGFQQAGR
jgi:hypothetical protein